MELNAPAYLLNLKTDSPPIGLFAILEATKPNRPEPSLAMKSNDNHLLLSAHAVRVFGGVVDNSKI